MSEFGLMLHGKPVLVTRFHNGDDRYACGEFTWKMSTTHGDIFRVGSAIAAERARQIDSQWFNSEECWPCHGGLDLSEAVVVELSTKIVAGLPEIVKPVMVQDVKAGKLWFVRGEGAFDVGAQVAHGGDLSLWEVVQNREMSEEWADDFEGCIAVVVRAAK